MAKLDHSFPENRTIMDLGDLAMILDGVDKEAMSCTHPMFTEAAESVRGISAATIENETQLQLYGLYKQSTVGDVNTSQPWAIDVVGRSKWDAWKAFEGFPKESAARTYVYVVSNLLQQAQPPPIGQVSSGNGSSSSGNGGNNTPGFGNSATNTPSPPPAASASVFDGMGISISTLHASQERDTTARGGGWKEGESLFAAVVEGDVEKVVALVNTLGCDVNLRNEGGMTALHYAADRGNLVLVKLLVEHNADVNIRDNEDQSPLAIAEICDHQDIVSFLITLPPLK